MLSIESNETYYKEDNGSDLAITLISMRETPETDRCRKVEGNINEEGTHSYTTKVHNERTTPGNPHSFFVVGGTSSVEQIQWEAKKKQRVESRRKSTKS